jgi:hypothetical protein
MAFDLFNSLLLLAVISLYHVKYWMQQKLIDSLAIEMEVTKSCIPPFRQEVPKVRLE